MEGKCDKYYKNCRLTCGRCKGGKCKDYAGSKFCKEMMEAGKCNQLQVAKMCLKTCDKCSGDGGEVSKCKDKKPSKKCKKMMEAGKCEDKKVAKKCMKTCDMCEEDTKKSN